jgi:rubredoxin
MNDATHPLSLLATVSIALAALSGCSESDEGGQDGEEGAGGEDTGEDALPPATQFDAAPISWSTPNGGSPWSGFGTVSGGQWDDGHNFFATMDLTGDSRPDLVVTSLSGQQFGEPGGRHWLVFENTGAGFAAEPILWGTPDGGSSDYGFNQVAGGQWDSGFNYYATLDLTGDGRPDLVVTALSGSQYGQLGNRYWQVYENTGSGFAAEPIYWGTPDGGSSDYGFEQVAGGQWDSGFNYYTTLDLTGDARPDLVVTALSGSQFGQLGNRYWQVYENTGSGFAAEPIYWGTPDGGSSDFGFEQVAGGQWDSGFNYYATLDLTGDARPDLVVSALSGSQFGDPGNRHWQVYENTGAGFAAEPALWATPDGGSPTAGFDKVAGGQSDGGYNHYVTMEVTGDGKPDLVVTSLSGAQFGEPGGRYWLVYPGVP